MNVILYDLVGSEEELNSQEASTSTLYSLEDCAALLWGSRGFIFVVVSLVVDDSDDNANFNPNPNPRS